MESVLGVERPSLAETYRGAYRAVLCPVPYAGPPGFRRSCVGNGVSFGGLLMPLGVLEHCLAPSVDETSILKCQPVTVQIVHRSADTGLFGASAPSVHAS